MNIKDNHQYRGVMRSFVQIATTESPRRLFRGIGVVATGAGPAHALYFSCYEFTKKFLSGNSRSNVLAQGNNDVNCHFILSDVIIFPLYGVFT